MNPYLDYLYTIRDNDDQELPATELALHFHQTVAQLLFLCMRSRPDIQALLSFLTTRVKPPDVDN